MAPTMPSVSEIKDLTDKEIEALWCRLRWPEGRPRCPKCHGVDVYDLSRNGKPVWRCAADRGEFSLTSGTPFASSKLKLRSVLTVLSVVQHHKGDKSVLQISRDLGMQYKTVYVLFGKAQEMLSEGVDQKSRLVGYMNTSARKTNRIRAARAKIGRSAQCDTATDAHHESAPSRSASEVLSHARYAGGHLWATGSWWTAQDKHDLAVLAAAKVSAQAAGVALGRSPKSIAWYARDLVSLADMPTDWKAQIAQPRIVVTAQPRLLAYPYLPKLTKFAAISGAQLTMDVSALVSRAYPEFMRADICQITLLAILEGKVTLSDLRGSSDALRTFVRSYRRGQEAMPGVGGGMQSRRISLDAPRWGDDDRDAHEIALPSGAMNRLEW